MLWWLFVLALFYASARWTAVSMVVSVFFFAFGVVGLLMMLQTGFIPVFLKTIFEIPLRFLQGIFVIIKAVCCSHNDNKPVLGGAIDGNTN